MEPWQFLVALLDSQRALIDRPWPLMQRLASWLACVWHQISAFWGVAPLDILTRSRVRMWILLWSSEHSDIVLGVSMWVLHCFPLRQYAATVGLRLMLSARAPLFNRHYLNNNSFLILSGRSYSLRQAVAVPQKLVRRCALYPNFAIDSGFNGRPSYVACVLMARNHMFWCNHGGWRCV